MPFSLHAFLPRQAARALTMLRIAACGDAILDTGGAVASPVSVHRGSDSSIWMWTVVLSDIADLLQFDVIG